MKQSWKNSLFWGIVGGFATLLVCRYLFGCVGSETALAAGKYSANLEECNRTAKNLCESIACENHYRAAAGRFPRAVPVHCETIKAEGTQIVLKDGGDQ